MHSKMNRKGLWLLLTLAVLIVAVSVLVAIAISADQEPAEFADFSYQTLSALDLADDGNTSLRFLFTIARTDYDEVGFVFSKTNATPTTSDYKKPIDTVYRSVIADGNTLEADEGRHWVVVKMTNIPHEYFDGALYVRGYVVDGGVTRYTDAESLTVCSAAGHTAHTVTLQYSGTASMTGTGTKIGYCEGCNLYNVTQYDVQNACEGKKWTSGGGSDSWVDSRQISTVLAGGKHFYPDESNGGLGNDLIVEYSVLWNETLLNMMPRYTQDKDHKYDAVVLTAFATDDHGYGSYKSLGYWGLTDNVPGSGAQIAGAFEYPNPLIQTNEPGNPYPGMNADYGIYSDYPNIGGTVIKNPEWGWHRIGIVYHEDVTNLSAVQTNGDAAQYKMTVTLYIDGEVVSVLSGSDLYYENGSHIRTAEYQLYTVTSDGKGGLTYADINPDYYIYLFGIRNTKANTSGTDVYFVDGDAFVNAGHGFVQNVKRIDNPKSNSETVTTGDNFGPTTFSTAPFYYTTGDFCVSHTWDETYTPGKAATLLGKGTKIDHCSVCGIARESVDNATSATVVSQTWTTNSTGSYPSNSTDTSSPLTFNVLTDILDGGKNAFYPTAGNPDGNDLLVEYSILWNPTLLNLTPGNGNASGAPYIGTGIRQNTGSQLNNIMYWSPTANMPYSGCQYAGGIEYASLTTSEPGNPYPNMIKNNQGIEKYPNIGGNNDGDGQTQAQDQYGWHRVQIRLHQEVTNLAALKASKTENSPAATYKLTGYIYIDGALVSVLSDDMTKWNSNNLLFTANADGKGGVTYGTVQSDRILNAVRANLTTAASDSVYFSVADVYATCGHDFVQQVQRVQYPEGDTSDNYSHRLYYASVDAPAVNVLTSSTEGAFGVKKNIVYDILKGEHFYPDASNDYQGNDLYVEYSILWNQNLVNKLKVGAKSEDGLNPFVDTRIVSYDGDFSNAISYWSLADGIPYSGCKYAGGFEYTALRISEDGNPYPNMIKDKQDITNYPNIGGANTGDGAPQGNDRYGWHRIGMQFHQEVTNLDALKADDGNGVAAQYKLTCHLYIDGKLVSILSNGFEKWNLNILLFSAESDGAGGVTYSDIGADRWLYIIYLASTKANDDTTATFTYKDCYATAGHSFVQKVTPLDSAINDHYYTVGSHTHDYHYETLIAATLLNDGSRKRVCAVCGAFDAPETVEYVPYQKVFTNSNDEAYGDRKYLREIQENNHFYPTDGNPEGNDLLIEFSILWNPTFSNFGTGSNAATTPFVTARISRWGGSGANNLVYWSLRDGTYDAWCKFAGGFEAGHAQSIDKSTPNGAITPDGMCAARPGGLTDAEAYALYPNIGGSTPANYSNLNNGHKWGWHRIGIRMHQTVKTPDADIIAGTIPEYRVTVTTYFDGVAVSELYKEGTAAEMFNEDGEGSNLLFIAKSDGKGHVVYSDSDYLTKTIKENGKNVDVSRTVWAFKVNYTKTATGNAYWQEADIYYTCGHNFVQKVKPVASPDYVDYVIPDTDVHVNGAIYYEFND